MSLTPGPVAMLPSTLYVWKGLDLLKHRVHVADEQHALAAFSRLGAGVLGDQHACALHLFHRNPLHLEAEVGQLRLHDLSDGADAFKVMRAAVDVDEFREQGIGSLLVCVDVGHDGFLIRREGWRSLGERDRGG